LSLWWKESGCSPRRGDMSCPFLFLSLSARHAFLVSWQIQNLKEIKEAA
jgi:hypothetical protein